MKVQVYTLETKFNFGKFKGKSLKEVLEDIESRYIGYLILNEVLWFILDIRTLELLEKEGFFDNLDFSYYGNGGFVSFEDIGIKKEEILSQMKKRYEDFKSNPEEYTRKAILNYKSFIANKKI